MKKKTLILISGLVLCGIILLSAAYINSYVKAFGEKNIFEDTRKLPQAQTALILGARVLNGGKLSDMLKDRSERALSLYKAGKVKKILMSGDHGQKDYDEVNAVKDFLLSKGVKPQDLFLDHAGFDTYDSIYRAKEIFGVQSLIIVTQRFHLPRAVYIARSLGISANGFTADQQTYVTIKYNELREIPARIKSFLDVLFHANPKFLGDKIPITGDSAASWD
jgi:SanA protein